MLFVCYISTQQLIVYSYLLYMLIYRIRLFIVYIYLSNTVNKYTHLIEKQGSTTVGLQYPHEGHQDCDRLRMPCSASLDSQKAYGYQCQIKRN